MGAASQPTVEVLARGGLGGVSFTDNLPLCSRATRGWPIWPSRATKNPFKEHQNELLEKMYQGTNLAGEVRKGLDTRRQASSELQQEMVDSARGAVNAKGFEQEARRMARLMRDNPSYAVGFVDVGGWDTHVRQGAAHGALSDRLRSLGEGLAGFEQEMGKAWDDTVVIVLSEFGRTFRENDRGTDHTAV
jgi:uncharacterized protein (DUF1501 family)